MQHAFTYAFSLSLSLPQSRRTILNRSVAVHSKVLLEAKTQCITYNTIQAWVKEHESLKIFEIITYIFYNESDIH